MKRRAEHAPPGGSPAKRQKVTSAAKLPPHTNVPKNVELTGKGLLKTKLRESKVRIAQQVQRTSLVQKELSHLKRKYSDCEHLVAQMKRYWTTLTGDVGRLLRSIDQDPALPRPKLTARTPDTLQELLTELSTQKLAQSHKISDSDSEESDDDEELSKWSRSTEEFLKGMLKQTSGLVGQLVDALNKRARTSKQLWQTVCGGNGLPAAAQKEVAEARAAAGRGREATTRLNLQIRELENRDKLHAEALSSSRERLRWLGEQNYLIVTAYNRLLRNYAYMSEQQAMAKGGSRSPTSSSGGGTADQGELDQQRQVAEGRLKQIEKLKQEVVRLTTNNAQMKQERAELNSQVDSYSTQLLVSDTSLETTKKQLALIQCQHTHRQQQFDEGLQAAQAACRERLEELTGRMEGELQGLNEARERADQAVADANSNTKGVYTKQLEKIIDDNRKHLEETRNVNKRLIKQIENKETVAELKKKLEIAKGEIKKLKSALSKHDGERQKEAAYKLEMNKLYHKSRMLQEELNKIRKDATAEKVRELNKTIELLMKEVNNSAKQVEDEQAKGESRVRGVQDALRKLQEEHQHTHAQVTLKAHKIQRVQQENRLLGEKITVQEQKSGKLDEERRAIQKQVTDLKSQTETVTQALNLAQMASSQYKEMAQTTIQQVSNLQIALRNKEEVLDQHKKQLGEEARTHLDTQSENNRLKEKNEELVKKHEKLASKANTWQSNTTMGKELEIALKKCVCPICNERKKECVNVKCGHMACNTCIQDQINSRNRKCAQCGQRYGGKHDFIAIYF